MDNAVVSTKRLKENPVKGNLRWLGGVVALISLLFIGYRLWNYGEKADLGWLNAKDWLMLSVLTIIYCTANFVLARGWWHLLLHVGARPRQIWALRTYGISQIGKYLPGNIFHLAGRQAMGMLAGLDGKLLAKSVAAELSLIVFAGTIFSIFGLPLIPLNLTPFGSVALFLVIAGISVFQFVQRSAWLVLSALICQTIYLILSGLVFVGTLSLVAPGLSFTPSFIVGCCGAFVCAWLSGLVTPGAPAGAGVREMVLWFFLSSAANHHDILLAVVFSRMVTVAGDLLFFLAARLIPQIGAGTEFHGADT